MELLEIDLLDHRPLRPRSGPVLVLVRAGAEVLGEVHLRWYDPQEERATRRMLADRYAERIATRDDVVADGAAGGLPATAVGVVVVTRGDARALADCLAALDGGEVVVAGVGDPAATAHAEAVAAQAGRPWVSAPTVPAAKDAGWQRVGGEVVAFLDEWARPPAHHREAVGAAFLAPGIGAVLGPVLAAELLSPAQRALDSRQSRARSFRRHLLDPAADGLGVRDLWLSAGVNLAVRRTVLEALGGFSSGPPDASVRSVAADATGWAADVALVDRAVRAGSGVLHEPNAWIRRVGDPDWRSALAEAHRHGAGHQRHLAPGRRALHRRRRLVALGGALHRRELGVAALLAAEAVGAWTAGAGGADR